MRLPVTLPTTTTEVNYHDNGYTYTGTIPTEFGVLTAVTQLNLASNQLSGSIPTELGAMTAVVSGGGLLDTAHFLSMNDFTSAIPTELGQISKLTSNFALDGNSLSSPIPTELGQLSQVSGVSPRSKLKEQTKPPVQAIVPRFLMSTSHLASSAQAFS